MPTIVCFGDSNTYGTPPVRALGEWGRFGPQERWPGRLRQTLGSDWHVIEEGLPGRTILQDDPIEGAHKNGLKLLPAVLESHRPIDLMIVMLGTNDLKARFGLPAEDVARSLAVMTETILRSPAGPEGQAPAVLLIAPATLLETGPFVHMFAGAAAKSQDLGALFEQVAAKLGTGFLDAAPLVRVAPEEGIHFGADQHAILAAAVEARVRETLSRT
jgi:lysophospholipase L1-like esterase